jgi:predicted dehydrogenase
MSRRARVGVVGCGDVLRAYMTGLQRFPSLVEVVWCSDLIQSRAQAAATAYGVPHAGSIDDLLRDDDVDVIVSLTPPKAHASVIESAAAAGKHVFSEKPLATTVESARMALAKAGRQGVRVGVAPDTFLGATAQTARAAVDRGEIGEPIGIVAFATHGRVDAHHPNPGSFFRPGGGPVLDVGPYFIAALVNLLGPIAAVSGLSRVGGALRRVRRESGEILEIPVGVDTHATASLAFASGAIGTLVASFDIWDHELPSIEVYGTEGTLSVPYPTRYDGEVRVRLHDDAEWHLLEPVLPPVVIRPREKLRGLGVIDLAQACDGGIQRTSAALALHTLEVLTAIEASSQGRRVVEIENTCERPAPVSPEDYSEWGLA